MGKKHVELPGAFTEPVDTQPVPSPEPGEPETAGLADLGVTSMDAIRTTATDPPVSEAQRRAMFAAAAGHSNLGIPKKVGREFVAADTGGHLPKRKKRGKK